MKDLLQTTGEHVDVHDLGLVGAQRELVQTIIATGTPTVVVFVAGKPITEESISNSTPRVPYNAQSSVTNTPYRGRSCD